MATVKKFQGKDRRLLNKAYDVLNAITERDLIAADLTKKSSAISTRDAIFDVTDTALTADVLGVKTRLAAALAETKPA